MNYVDQTTNTDSTQSESDCPFVKPTTNKAIYPLSVCVDGPAVCQWFRHNTSARCSSHWRASPFGCPACAHRLQSVSPAGPGAPLWICLSRFQLARNSPWYFVLEENLRRVSCYPAFCPCRPDSELRGGLPRTRSTGSSAQLEASVTFSCPHIWCAIKIDQTYFLSNTVLRPY